MKKKAYKKPEMEVVKMQQLQMMCGSPKTLRGTNEFGVELE